MDMLYQALLSLAVGSLSAFLTTRFTLNKFYTEKWWEKKVEAFAALTDAAYLLQRANQYWRDHHYYTADPDNYPGFIPLLGDEVTDLRKQYRHSLAVLEKYHHLGPLLTSKKSSEILENFFPKYNDLVPSQWFEIIKEDKFFDESLSLSSQLLKDLLSEAKKELKAK